MTNVQRPAKCANCAYEMDRPTVVVDGESYCCSGCVQGGPCLCSYSESPDTSGVPFDEYASVEDPSLADDSPGGLYSAAFARLVNNVLKEVEITQQAMQDRQGPVKDLLDLLERTARLLQIMTYRVEGQKQSNPAPAPHWVSRIQSDVATREAEETVKLLVQGLNDQDMVFCYTRALAKLGSVNELKLVNVNGGDVCYQVHTPSKAKLARDVMSLPDYQALRVHSTPEEITVVLKSGWPPNGLHADLAASTSPSMPTQTGAPSTTPPAWAGNRRPGAGGGFMEVGIDGFFNSRHYLVKDGEPGPVEMKSWRVEISLEGDQADESGRLEGLDRARTAIEVLLSEYNNKLLNNVPPYDQIQPTPENIARTLYNQVSALISDEHLYVKGLKVWVNPTQYVWYSESSGNAA